MCNQKIPLYAVITHTTSSSIYYDPSKRKVLDWESIDAVTLR